MLKKKGDEEAASLDYDFFSETTGLPITSQKLAEAEAGWDKDSGVL